MIGGKKLTWRVMVESSQFVLHASHLSFMLNIQVEWPQNKKEVCFNGSLNLQLNPNMEKWHRIMTSIKRDIRGKKDILSTLFETLSLMSQENRTVTEWMWCSWEQLILIYVNNDVWKRLA